jgi:hypothetical protein
MLFSWESTIIEEAEADGALSVAEGHWKITHVFEAVYNVLNRSEEKKKEGRNY